MPSSIPPVFTTPSPPGPGDPKSATLKDLYGVLRTVREWIQHPSEFHPSQKEVWDTFIHALHCVNDLQEECHFTNADVHQLRQDITNCAGDYLMGKFPDANILMDAVYSDLKALGCPPP